MDGLREIFENNKSIIIAVVALGALFLGKKFLTGGEEKPRTVQRQLSRPGEGGAMPMVAASTPAPAPAAPTPAAASAATPNAAPASPASTLPEFKGYPEISTALDPSKHMATTELPRTVRNPYRDFKMDQSMDSAAINQIAVAESEINRISGEYSDAIQQQREQVQTELARPRELLEEARAAYYDEVNYLKASIVGQRCVNAIRILATRIGPKIQADQENTTKMKITSISYKYKGFYDLGKGPIAILEKTVLSPDIRGGRQMSTIKVTEADKLELASVTDNSEKWAEIESIESDRIVLSETDDEGEKTMRVHFLQTIRD